MHVTEYNYYYYLGLYIYTREGREKRGVKFEQGVTYMWTWTWCAVVVHASSVWRAWEKETMSMLMWENGTVWVCMSEIDQRKRKWERERGLVVFPLCVCVLINLSPDSVSWLVGCLFAWSAGSSWPHSLVCKRTRKWIETNQHTTQNQERTKSSAV